MRFVSLFAPIFVLAACGRADRPDTSSTKHHDTHEAQPDPQEEEEPQTNIPADACEVMSLSPCGGDLVGTWTLGAACPTSGLIPTLESCTDSGWVGTPGDLTVERTFNANGTYTAVGSGGVNATFTVGAACIQSQSQGFLTPIQFCQLFEVTVETQLSGTTATCAATGGQCICDAYISLTTQEAGTYHVHNGKLTTTPNGGTAFETSYCVDDEGLLTLQERQMAKIGGHFAVYE